MVVDTSILLSVFFNEAHSSWSLDSLASYGSSLRMSTVNLAEVLILVEDRQPQQFAGIKPGIFSSSIRFVPPTTVQAEIAAKARLKYPLNLGDCFAYALAKDEGCPILTLDADFRTTDLNVVSPQG